MNIHKPCTHLPSEPLRLGPLCLPLLVAERPLVASAAAVAAGSCCNYHAAHGELHRRPDRRQPVSSGGARRRHRCRQAGCRNACSRHASDSLSYC